MKQFLGRPRCDREPGDAAFANLPSCFVAVSTERRESQAMSVSETHEEVHFNTPSLQTNEELPFNTPSTKSSPKCGSGGRKECSMTLGSARLVYASKSREAIKISRSAWTNKQWIQSLCSSACPLGSCEALFVCVARSVKNRLDAC